MSQGDEDLAGPVEARFREEGMTGVDQYPTASLYPGRHAKVAHLTHEGKEKTVSAEVILQALGRQPNISGLNVEAARVEVHRGKIAVDDTMRTSQPHIYAVGDVNGLHEIVHIAIQQEKLQGGTPSIPSPPLADMTTGSKPKSSLPTLKSPASV